MSAGRKYLDVSGLPSTVIGQREPLWWGLILMCAIEATMFGLLFMSYLYIRAQQHVWPPQPIDTRTLIWGLSAVACWIASALPIHLTARATRTGSLRGMRNGLIGATVLGAGALVFRCLEIADVPFRWDSHAHGSLWFAMIGFHTFHVITDFLENVMLIVLLYRGPVEDKHRNDVYVNCVYWYFVVATSIAVATILYGDAFLFAKG